MYQLHDIGPAAEVVTPDAVRIPGFAQHPLELCIMNRSSSELGGRQYQFMAHITVAVFVSTKSRATSWAPLSTVVTPVRRGNAPQPKHDLLVLNGLVT